MVSPIMPYGQAESLKFKLLRGLPAVRTTDPSPLDIRFDADDALPTYIGLNFESYNADTSVSNWTVIKFTYSGSSATRIQIREDVAYDDRATLF